ncbi:hypothetical protein IL306_001196 [Fusarium sp. DS 682]|nr:hypothetical protein IL306_001196 [Fusarium sp. DS 682]
MTHDNDLLRNSVDAFTRIVNTVKPAPKVFCSYESKAAKLGRIAGLNTAPEFVVNQTSGTLNGHQNQELSLDHFGMNKFEDDQDSHYRSVKREIVRIIKAHTQSEGDELSKSPSN